MTDEERKEYKKRWYAAHPGYNTKYSRKWREKNHERFNELCRNYQAKHRDEQQQRMNDYHQTKEGRASNLLSAYVQMDLESGRGMPKLTRDDIIRKCFSDGCQCVYCQCDDWTKLGLDRLDNDKPHDAANCVCSCRDCNVKKYRAKLGDFIERIGYSWLGWMEMNGMKYAEPLKIAYGRENVEEN